MKKYRFSDYNPITQAEQELEGKEYVCFLETCFCYCASVSFIVKNYKGLPPVHVIPQLEQYRIPVTQQIVSAYRHYGFRSELYTNEYEQHEIRHYRLCTESCALIRCVTRNLFSWINGWEFHNPEDPMFFRADGSLFFESVIHEGHATLFPRDDEDVSAIISDPRWLETD